LNPVDKVPRTFNDYWWRCLPNDDLTFIDTWIRVQFTEIWIDIEKAPEVISVLQELFQTSPEACGNFGCEVYSAKRSPYWMSMSYGRDVIRIDPYWFEYNLFGNINDFFTLYWNKLLNIETARLHWGKHFPKFGTKFSNYTIGPDYVRKSYPRFDDWLALRQKYDPQNIFVTSYWKQMFGL